METKFNIGECVWFFFGGYLKKGMVTKLSLKVNLIKNRAEIIEYYTVLFFDDNYHRETDEFRGEALHKNITSLIKYIKTQAPVCERHFIDCRKPQNIDYEKN